MSAPDPNPADGGWFAICGPAGIGLLSPSFPLNAALTCWQRLQRPCQLSDLLGDLAGASGGRLGILPPFAVAVLAPDGWRIALREPILVQADGERLDGRGAATWREHGPLTLDRLELRPAGGDSPTMPDGLTSAIALTGGVCWPGCGPSPDDAARGLPEAASDAVDETQLPDYTDLREADESGDSAGLRDSLAHALAGSEAGTDSWPAATGLTMAAPGSSAWPADPGVAESDSPGNDAAEARPRQSLGRARLSTGEVLELDEAIVIGRRPRAARPSGAPLPRLIAVPSPGRDVSRSHLQILVDDGEVLVCDLGATNGTMLKRKGRPLRRLQSRESVAPRKGDVFHLGDGVSLTIEELR